MKINKTKQCKICKIEIDIEEEDLCEGCIDYTKLKQRRKLKNEM